MKAEDLYALRCAFLHHGEDDIESQRARESINKFMFVNSSQTGIIAHNNISIKTNPNGKIDTRLQLDVNILCTQMIEAVVKWQQNNQNYQDGKLMEIQSSGNLIF